MPMKVEVESISKDLEEVYKEIGASALYINKCIYTEIDNIYNAQVEKTEIPYKVIGKVSLLNPLKEEQTNNLGNSSNCNYRVVILKSSLASHNILDVTTSDTILYNDTLLEISSVKPSIVLGDYFVQYELEAYGERVKLDGE